MKHTKQLTVGKSIPVQAMDASTILFIIGTVMTGVGSLLIAISPFIGGKGD